jgi:hypothetical protein
MSRTTIPRIALGLAVAAGVTVSVAGPANAAGPAYTAAGSVKTQLVGAIDPCTTRVARPADAGALSRCARDLVGPDTREPYIFDLFNTFTDCLYEASHSDSMYPGIDPSEVNHCLEDHGFL